MKTGKALAISVAVAAAVGAVFVASRELYARECREAVARLATPAHDFGDESVAAALAISRDLDRDKALECYREGALSSPP